ncbi:MAG: ABC transporter ATP-binding protein [Acidobacteria bacterium]|nr:MAG: ABC transporter ATP-binding protein [Acidobacteriota bacterium]
MSDDQTATGTKKLPALKSVWREARELMWERRWRLLIGLVLILVNRAAAFVLPLASKHVIDDVIGRRDLELLTTLALVVGVATVVQAASSFTLAQLVSLAAQRSIADMRKRVQQQVLRLPVSYFDHTKSGILIARVMNDAEGIRNLVGTGIVQLLSGLLTAGVGLGYLFYLNWQMTTVTLAVLLAFGALMGWAFSRLRPIFRQRNEVNAQISGRLAEALGGVRVVKAYTAEKREDRVFAKGVHQLLRLVNRTIVATSAVSAGSSLLFGAIGLIMMLIGVRSVVDGGMTLGDLFKYITLTGMVAAAMVQISSITTQLSEAFAGLDRIREILDQETEDMADAERQPLPELRGEIALEDVSFEYVPGTPVLRGVSLKAAPGTTTALVGSSGAGKSTLVSLIMTFIRPTRGRVLVDGKDLRQVRLRDYRRYLGVVLQDNFLFDGTVAENIAYARPHASREEIEAAGRIAHCHEFVTAFDQGYDTVVGERGVKLSGGQRQRVAIARAILADPRILILDEATSSLDSESEAMIQDGLRSLRRGRTTFVIAHRLSTIQSADQILVLEDGEIVERGTHEELLARGGRYRELYDTQYKIERDRFINPGEDFTPEPPDPSEIVAAVARPGRSRPL